ncbi:MAG TPA: GNAT family N-acetyltransferase [Spirochaetales bacterium]|nr:GNAT family N-acetyltransferase [Spirochaetales bacterium]HRY53805.1 GNAT family N-acetyltransferase [Spirochaetia bacterium]HRZ65108.1 GNAT family N-acetyltransferase [Spirochaetia bacterium]
MDIRSLEGEPPQRIYEAFMEAFADYQVPVAWSREDFEANKARRGFEASISVGAYEDGRLVGFSLNGRGSWGGAPTAYDLGTGVAPAARGSGLAGRLAEAAKELLPRAGIRRYLLEVLRDNAPAIRTYERAGFRVTRLFECPGGTFIPPGGAAATPGLSIEELSSFPAAEAAAIRDWEPSWQNSDEAIARMPGPLVLLGAREGARLAGFLVAQPSGTIWQLAVAREARRRGLGSALLAALAARSGGALRYVNVQADDAASLGLLARCGAAQGPGQYEMLLELSAARP